MPIYCVQFLVSWASRGMGGKGRRRWTYIDISRVEVAIQLFGGVWRVVGSHCDCAQLWWALEEGFE